MHLGIILVNNQLDAQFFFMYVHFYSPHVSGSHVPIIRRINEKELCVKLVIYKDYTEMHCQQNVEDW